MNIILKPFYCCPECYSTDFKRDFKRSEIYCSECGLVLANSVPFRTTEYIRNKQKEKQQLQHLKQYKELEPIIDLYEVKVQKD